MKDKDKFLKLAGQAIAPYRKDKNGLPIVQGRSINVGKKGYNYSWKLNQGDATDPMAFRYNYHALHRKRKDKKIPYYMSSKDTYYNYIREKR